MDPRASQATHPDLHVEAFAWLMKTLDEAEKDEFYAGFRDIGHALIDAVFTREPSRSSAEQVVTDMLNYIESWIVSISMHQDPEWQHQVELSQKAWANDEGNVSSASEFKTLLSR